MVVRVFARGDGGATIWREQRSVRALRAASGVRVPVWKGQRDDGLIRLRPYIPLAPRRVPIPLVTGGRFRVVWVSVPRPSLVSFPLFLATMVAVGFAFADELANAAATGARVAALEDTGAASALFWPWYLAFMSGLVVMAVTRGWDRLGYVTGSGLTEGMVVRVPGHHFAAATVTEVDQIGDLVDVEFHNGRRVTVEAGRVLAVLQLR